MIIINFDYNMKNLPSQENAISMLHIKMKSSLVTKINKSLQITKKIPGSILFMNKLGSLISLNLVYLLVNFTKTGHLHGTYTIILVS